jgi:hypothetical protein
MAKAVARMSRGSPEASGAFARIRRRLFEARRGWREEIAARRATPHPDPVFVLGTQKSGTTAVAALLGLAAGQPVSLDLVRDLRRPTAMLVVQGRLGFGRFVRRHAVDFSRPIVKEPNLTFLLPWILRRWPRARTLFVVRNPLQTVRSVLDRLGLPGDRDGLDPAAEIPPGWRPVLDSRWVGAAGDDMLTQLGGRARIAAEIALATLRARPETTRVLTYEAFLGDKAGAIRAVAADLGLPSDGEIEPHLETPFQPAGRGERDPHRFFGAALPRLLSAVRGPAWASLGIAGFDAEATP